jgi:DNA-binding CsgD family transcriptional regulator
MSKDFREIAEYWKKEYSNKITEKKSFKTSEQFRQLAAFFAPGKSYYYIVNFHDLNLELVSDSVIEFIGIDSKSVKMQDLLGVALPEEIEGIKKKESVINDFFLNFLDTEDILYYKVIYSYRMRDAKGKIKTILHQATPLSVAENGFFQHVFSVHTDISHLKVSSTRDVSFVNLKSGTSYYNINTEKEKFDPAYTEFKENCLNDMLSDREKEIIKELANGLSAKDIASRLFISPHTVKTHRKNILSKTGCNNTAQLIAKCLTSGVISPGMN